MELPEFDLTPGERLYLLLDGGQLPELERQLFEVSDSPAYQPLYLYAPWDSLREASPCLVEASEPLLSWFKSLPANAGWLLASPLALLPLADQLRQLIEVESPYGSQVLLKIAQPEGMARLLVDDTPLLWQGISQVWLPVRQQILPNGPLHWWHKRVSDTLAERKDERLRLNDQQWARLGEVSWLDTLDTIARHMRKWFPARLVEQTNDAQWIAKWASWGHRQGFITQADLLCLFTVLGYLGEACIDAKRYPEVARLLTLPAQQTPAQRVEQAAEWAEQQHEQQRSGLE